MFLLSGSCWSRAGTVPWGSDTCGFGSSQGPSGEQDEAFHLPPPCSHPHRENTSSSLGQMFAPTSLLASDTLPRASFCLFHLLSV